MFTSEYNQPQMIKRKVNDVDDDDGIHISYSSTVYKCVRIKKAVHRKRIKKKKQFQIKKHPIFKKKTRQLFIFILLPSFDQVPFLILN